jgi:hypothetical protein
VKLRDRDRQGPVDDAKEVVVAKSVPIATRMRTILSPTMYKAVRKSGWEPPQPHPAPRVSGTVPRLSQNS